VNLCGQTFISVVILESNVNIILGLELDHASFNCFESLLVLWVVSDRDQAMIQVLPHAVGLGVVSALVLD